MPTALSFPPTRESTSFGARGTRTTQVNVRLTQEEEALLTSAAAQSGFQGLGDYLRATVLAHARSLR